MTRLQAVVRPLTGKTLAKITDSASIGQGDCTTVARFFILFPPLSFIKMYLPTTHAKADNKPFRTSQCACVTAAKQTHVQIPKVPK